MTIVYPGASPTEVESQVTKPVEDAVVSLNGLDRVMTFSHESVSTTVIQFKLGVECRRRRRRCASASRRRA